METQHMNWLRNSTATLLWIRYSVHRPCYQGKSNMSQYKHKDRDIHAQSGIQTHNPSNQAALDHAATGTGH
jgi:hypothetical protein